MKIQTPFGDVWVDESREIAIERGSIDLTYSVTATDWDLVHRVVGKIRTGVDKAIANAAHDITTDKINEANEE